MSLAPVLSLLRTKNNKYCRNMGLSKSLEAPRSLNIPDIRPIKAWDQTFLGLVSSQIRVARLLWGIKPQISKRKSKLSIRITRLKSFLTMVHPSIMSSICSHSQSLFSRSSIKVKIIRFKCTKPWLNLAPSEQACTQLFHQKTKTNLWFSTPSNLWPNLKSTLCLAGVQTAP